MKSIVFGMTMASCAVIAGVGVILGLPPRAEAGSLCPPNLGPDVIVVSVSNPGMFGTVGGITAYSFWTTACNAGDEDIAWFAESTDHPVIAQNVYRLRDGRFEQIGMSWLKHGFGAATLECCGCQPPGSNFLLGPGCGDTYTANTNADQDGMNGRGGLGPRSDINPTTGVFPWPYTTQGVSGDAIYKRMQVANDDLDPALNPGALYFAECHYVSPQDAAAGNGNNNAAHRTIAVGPFVDGGWSLSTIGGTTPKEPAIMAWATSEAGVSIDMVDAPDGRYILGSKCTDNGDGTWHYEYALYNMNSHRAARSFEVPLANVLTASAVGFHDVDAHSGEIYDSTDWTDAVGGGVIRWSTDDFATNPNANALRWGTLYNFRFDAEAPPAAVMATVELFRPGTPTTIAFTTCGPMLMGCDEDLTGDNCVGFADLTQLLSAWGCTRCPADIDGSGDAGFPDLTALLSAWGPC